MSDTDVPRCSACGAPLGAPLKGGKTKCAYCHAVNVVIPQEKKKVDTILCPQCGTDNPREAKHCGHCGFKLKFNCPSCHAPNTYGSAYCIECGVDIQAELKRQEEAARRAKEEARLREEAMRRAQEEARRKQEEAARLEQEQAQRRWEEEIKKSRKQARTTNLIIVGVVSIALICIVCALSVQIYKANFSLQARQTRTAAAAHQTAVQQAAVARQTAVKQTAVARQTVTARGTLVQQTIARQTAIARQTIAAQTATANYLTLFHDDFSTSSSGWDVYNDGTSSASYERGGYRLRVFDSTRMMGGIQSRVFQTNVRIEVDVNRLDESVDSYFGIICRFQDLDNFYMFIVLNDGHAFIIGRSLQGEITAISSGEGGQNETNNTLTNSSAHIRADCNGNELTFYVNGIQVAKATDDTLQTGKQVGLMAGANGDEETDILFDNFYVYRP